MILTKQVFLVFTLFWATKLVYSQNIPTPMSIGIGLSNKINNTVFDNYWQSSYLTGINACVEQNIGLLGFGFDLIKFQKNISTTTDFWGVGYYFLYKYPLKIVTKIKVVPEINFGLFEFRFKDLHSNFNNNAGDIEREFFVRYLLGISYNLSENLQIEINSSFQKIYTKKQIDFIFVGTAIRYVFNSPNWLEDFLK